MNHSLIIFAIIIYIFSFSARSEEASSEIEKLDNVQQEQVASDISDKDVSKYNFDNYQGNPDSKVEIIEYASLSCSHCADFYKNIYPALKEKYIDTNKIKFVYRDFPLGGPPAFFASMLTHCVEKDKYHNMLEVLFKTQSNWAGKKNFIEILSNIAKLGKMTGEDFDKCMQDEELSIKLKESINYAQEKYSIRATPSFVINGKTYTNMGIDEFSAVIDKILEEE